MTTISIKGEHNPTPFFLYFVVFTIMFIKIIF